MVWYSSSFRFPLHVITYSNLICNLFNFSIEIFRPPPVKLIFIEIPLNRAEVIDNDVTTVGGKARLAMSTIALILTRLTTPLGVSKFDSVSAANRDQLHWLPIRKRIQFEIALHVRDCTSVRHQSI